MNLKLLYYSSLIIKQNSLEFSSVLSKCLLNDQIQMTIVMKFIFELPEIQPCKNVWITLNKIKHTVFNNHVLINKEPSRKHFQEKLVAQSLIFNLYLLFLI